MIKVVTHNGNFHPDDVFAVATLRLSLSGEFDVVRSRKEEDFKTADFCVDVGVKYDPDKNLFDHHQEGGAGARDNLAPYASFGLVWKKFGQKICGDKEIADTFDKEFIQYVDALDNGVGRMEPVMKDVYPYTIGDAVVAFNGTWLEKNDSFGQDKRFLMAVDFAEGVLKRAIHSLQSRLEARDLIDLAYKKAEDKRIIILGKKCPWQDYIQKYLEPLFVVSQNEVADSWEVEAVRVSPNGFLNRKDMPLSWAGKRDNALAEVSGVSDSIFAHNGRFFAVAKSKEGALKLAKLAIET